MPFGENPTPVETAETKKETTEQKKDTQDFSKLSLQLKEIQSKEQEDNTDNPDDYLKILGLDMEVNNQTEKELDNFIKETVNVVHDAKISDKGLNKFNSIINDLKPKILNGEDIRDELFNKIQTDIPEEYTYIFDALSKGININGEIIDFEKYIADVNLEKKEENKSINLDNYTKETTKIPR